MGRKKFEEVEYDPIEAEAKRSLARQVSSLGVVSRIAPTTSLNTVMQTNPIEKTRVISPGKKQKKRSFSCANSDQDFELDRFMLRMEEQAHTHIPFQVLMRAVCTVMMRAEEQIVSEMKKNVPTSCPATFAYAQYAEFEEYWTETIAKALRKTRPIG